MPERCSSASFPLAGLAERVPQWEQEMQAAPTTRRLYSAAVYKMIAWQKESGMTMLDNAGIDAWTKNLITSLKPKSIEVYRGAARKFLAWLAESSDVQPELESDTSAGLEHAAKTPDAADCVQSLSEDSGQQSSSGCISSTVFSVGSEPAPEFPFGMREMQARAYEKRNSRYLLLKAPPASGKSRAGMYILLDKLKHQGIRKVVVAVPDSSIGASFRNASLTSAGFFADWRIESKYRLCLSTAGEESKTLKFVRFLIDDPKAEILLCTHATLRNAWKWLWKQGESGMNCLEHVAVAIDEIHHASADSRNELGGVVDGIVKHSKAHVLIMTGSFFRGDAVPVLSPAVERLFDVSAYTWREQLLRCQWLRELSISYCFYGTGIWLDAAQEVMETPKKTIVYLPPVNSAAATDSKLNAAMQVFDIAGEMLGRFDEEANVYRMRASDGHEFLAADLVDDGPLRKRTLELLQKPAVMDRLELVTALGMAREGFDWPACERVAVAGYRRSLTEMVQILGRCARDYPGKTRAECVFMLAEPQIGQKSVKNDVNDVFKAVALALLMRDVLAPAVNFKAREDLKPGEKPAAGEVLVSGPGATPRVMDILNGSGLDAIVETLLTGDDAQKTLASAVFGGAGADAVFEEGLPRIIEVKHPDLSPEEKDILLQGVRVRLNVQAASRSSAGTKAKPMRHYVMKHIDVRRLDLDLVRSINPFHGAYEILSKAFTPGMLGAVAMAADASLEKMTDEEAARLWPRIEEFAAAHGGQAPKGDSNDSWERRLASALAHIRRYKAKQMRAAMQERTA